MKKLTLALILASTAFTIMANKNNTETYKHIEQSFKQPAIVREYKDVTVKPGEVRVLYSHVRW